jgi:hypothetical protein
MPAVLYGSESGTTEARDINRMEFKYFRAVKGCTRLHQNIFEMKTLRKN